ncbi:hypothetical protein SAMN04487967_2884 [Natronorubrum sediminis]|uniref:BPL/LPL catalytic domain-containing protein n=1 Tax=Natronorubrum sediminis TaxID=640943 RepID=A0A1H6G1I6_9EURY|nr:lipoate--protein ligase family protein [Natronorubrum sediminis]SEH16956.1 hypothetical protein SAMN04487967_2884 [Natronorubrum sediminis]
MRVIRGRGATVDADRELSRQLYSSVADGESAMRVWRPHRQVAFGRRDKRQEGYEQARERARARGFVPLERDVGGRAVAFDGETSLAFTRVEPIEDFRRGTTERYEQATADLEDALGRLGGELEVGRGEPERSFCPGTHSLSLVSSDGNRRKVAGLAQRVRQDVAVVAGVVLVANREKVANVLESVYDALALEFEPATVGTIAAAGGPSNPTAVRSALEDALVGDERAPVRIESVGT